MANTKIPVELSSTPGIVDGSNATAITIDSSENVGIGTSSPSSKLHVYGGAILVDNGSSAGTIYFHDTTNYINLSSDALQFANNGAERLRIDSSGQIGVGTTSPQRQFHIAGGSNTGLKISGNNTGSASGDGFDIFVRDDNSGVELVQRENTFMTFHTNNTERMRISSTGDVSIGTTSNTNDVADASSGNGFAYSAEASRDFLAVTRDSGVTAYFNRIGNGDVIAIRKNGATKGTISVNDATVSYNPFMGSHYSETSDSEILLGTVMEYTGELVENYNIEEKRLSKVKISDTSESTKVYGIYFANGDEIGGDLIAGLGASWCRINKDVTVQLGDLLVSNGDGTAKVQSDDIIRSKTIGKVTSTTVKETYSDGSYVVPVVLYCG